MSHPLSRRPDDVLRRIGAGSLRTNVHRIVKRYESADSDQRARGAEWYAEAREYAEALSTLSGYSVAHCAAVIAHLSPRTSWKRNIDGAIVLLLGGDPDFCITENVKRARAALATDDPIGTFGRDPRSLKTLHFVRCILGDCQSVTVDVWALRVIGLDETALRKAGAYHAIAHAYAVAAKRVGITPREMQATTWVQITDSERGKYRAQKG